MNQNNATKKYFVIEVSGDRATQCKSYDSASAVVESFAHRRGRPSQLQSIIRRASSIREKYSRDQEITINGKVYVSRKSAARILGVSVVTVANAVHAAECGKSPLVVIHPTGTCTNYIEKKSVCLFAKKTGRLVK